MKLTRGRKIIAGVLGGLLAFGAIGLFVGPVVLAVTYTLLVAWVRAGEPSLVGRPAVARPDSPRSSALPGA